MEFNSLQTPIIATPNTVKTQSVSKLLFLLSRGKIEGFVNTTDPLQDLYFNNTPISAGGGTYNINNVSVSFRDGDTGQSYIEGFEDVATAYNLGTKVLQATPGIYTATTTDVDAIRVTLRFPGLFEQGDNGDPKATPLTFKIYTKVGTDPWVEVRDVTINQPSTVQFDKDYLIDRPRTGTGSQSIKVERVTADNTSPKIYNDMYLQIVNEIKYVKLTYEGFALLAVKSAALGNNVNIPIISPHLRGVHVYIPSNYDPVTRTYTDPNNWDGLFKPNKAWSNNPALCLYTVLIDANYGLGEIIDPADIDQYSFYDAARYCDEQVFALDETGSVSGTEPRFQFNYQFMGNASVYEFIQNMAATFSAVVTTNGNYIKLIQDRPTTVTRQFTPSNVEGGLFNYSTVNADDIVTAATVWWNDPGQNSLSVPEYYQDDVAITRFKVYRQKEVTGIGVTTQGQARRLARNIVETAISNLEIINFKCGYNNAFIEVGEVVEIMDPYWAEVQQDGVLVSKTSGTITLDRAVTVASGDTFDVPGTSGTLETRTITSTGTLTTISFSGGAISALPGAVVVITGAISPRQFRISDVSEETPGINKVTGIFFDPNKFSRIDDTTPGPELKYRAQPDGYTVSPVSAIVFTEESSLTPEGIVQRWLTARWSPVANQLVTSYKVFGSIGDGELIDLGILSQPFIRVPVSVSGVYKAVVYAINARGKMSLPTVGTYTVDLDAPLALSDLLDVTTLVVKGTAGTDFTGRDLTVTWTDTNVSNEGPVQKGYKIRVKDSVTPTTIYREEFVPVGTTEYTYDYTKQLADNPLDPKRSVIIEVKVQDTYNKLTAGTSATFTNAAPATPTSIVLSANPEGASISLDPCTEFDYQNTVVWASTTPGFTLDATSRIEITNSSFLNYFDLGSSIKYYIRIAHTDSFTSDSDRETGANLNVSAEQSVTTGTTTGSMNTAMFAAYKRSATAPTDDPGDVTFTFGVGITTPATDALANGWYKTIPTADGNPLYGVGATAAGIGTTDTVLAAEWSDPIVLLNDGLDGVSAATVYLYQRTATNTPPSITGTSPANDMTYTFATGALIGTPPAGWTVAIPSSGGDYLWVTRATAVAAASVLTDVIDYTQWSAAESFAVNGTDGADAPLLTLSGTGFAFVFENENATTSSSPTISFDAVLQNVSGSVTWTVTAYNDAGSSLGTLTLGGSGNTGRTLTSTNFNSLGALTTQYVIVNATLGALSDTMTVYRGDGGSTLVQSVLSNEAHTFQASNTGVVGSYTGSGTEIRTYQGITELTYDGVGTTAGTWKVVAAPTGITTGTLTDSGTYLTVGNHSSMTTDQAYIDYTISGKDLQGVAFSYVKRQSFAKSNAGAPSGWITVKSNAGSVFLLNSSGTAATPSSIILSRTLGDGVTDTSAAGTVWTVTNGTFTGSLAVLNTTTGAFPSIEPSEMTTDSVTFRCEVTDTVTGYEYSDEITVYKSSDAVSGYLTNDSVSLPASSAGVISSYTGASGTFQLVNSRGNITATGSNPVFSIIGHSGFGTTYPTNTGISISNVGAYSVTSNILTATTVATVTFRAAYTDPVTATVKNVDRIFTISKSNSGTAGTAGTTGNSARKVYALYTGNPVISGAAVTVTDPTIVPAANAWSPAAASNFSYTVPTPSTGQSVFTADGTYDPVAGQTTFQQPYLANFKVGSLEVVSNVVAGGIQVNNGGSVYSGKSTSTSTGTAGFFLGSESGIAKLTVGDANLRKALMWDGTNLNLRVDGTSGLNLLNMASGSPVSLGGLYAQTVFSWPATVLASATGTGTVNRVALASTNTQGTGYGFLSVSPLNINSVEYSVSSPASGGTATIRGLNVTDTYIESTPASGSSNLRLQANGTSGALYISSSNITCNGNNTDFVIQSSPASGGQLRLKTGSGSSGYGVLFKQDGSDFYILRTASGSADGTWTTDRPFMYNFSSGVVTIEKLRINSMTVGTGAATATFTGTNKPGSNSSNTWLTLVINGTTYYIPAWT